MADRARGRWRNLSQSLWFVPGVMVVGFAGLAVGLVRLDEQLELEGVPVVFAGDGDAARTLLSVIAGSLITVAGLTFSMTMVVLQLASSQFSPRVLRTFFGDRVTQITIGTYVGTFVFALLVLRRVGTFGSAGFVPRIGVTTASLLGIAAVILLIVFLHHVSRLIQVSYVTAAIARDTLRRADALYPARHGEPVSEASADELLEAWQDDASAVVHADRPGYVERVMLDGLGERVGDRARRIAVLVAPGDFAGLDRPIARVWPPEAADGCQAELRGAIVVADERDLDQDVGFGIRQLTDIALRAMSPGINDPATAVTCINYLRDILVRLAGRATPSDVRRFENADLVVLVRQRRFEEHLEVVLHIGRYAEADAWVLGELRELLSACAAAARAGGFESRVRAIERA